MSLLGKDGFERLLLVLTAIGARIALLNREYGEVAVFVVSQHEGESDCKKENSGAVSLGNVVRKLGIEPLYSS